MRWTAVCLRHLKKKQKQCFLAFQYYFRTILLFIQAKGLPSKFETKDELATFVRQTLWIIVHHSALNYPIVEYSNTPAFNPTKIYEGMTSTSNHTFFDMLPGPISAVVSPNWHCYLCCGTQYKQTLR